MPDFMTDFAQFRKDFADIIDRNGNGIDDRLEGGLSDAGPVPTEMADPASVAAQQPAMNVGRNIATLGGFDAYQRGDTPAQYLENTARGAIGGAAKAAMFLPEMAQRGVEYLGGRMGMPDLAPNIERERYTAADEEFARNPYAGFAGAMAAPTGMAQAMGGISQVAPKVITPTTVGFGGAAATGATLLSPSAIGQDADMLPQLVRNLAGLQQKRTEAEQRRAANTPKGRNPDRRADPRYFAAIDDISKYDADMEALKSQIADERGRRDRIEGERNATFRDRRSLAENARSAALHAGKPFEEAHPWLAPAALAAGVMIPGALGAMRGRQAAMAVRESADGAKAALASGRNHFATNNLDDAFDDLGRAGSFVSAAENPTKGNAFMRVASHPLSGGIEAAAIANLPAELNALSLPSYNPERLAAERYFEQLHPDDPERGAVEAQIAALPIENKRKQNANREFMDNIGTRVGLPFMGGLAANISGASFGKLATGQPNIGPLRNEVDRLTASWASDGQAKLREAIDGRLQTLQQLPHVPAPIAPHLLPPARPQALLPPPQPVGGSPAGAPPAGAPTAPNTAPSAVPPSPRPQQPARQSRPAAAALTPAQRRGVQDDLLQLHEQHPSAVQALADAIKAGSGQRYDAALQLLGRKHGIGNLADIEPVVRNVLNLTAATSRPRELAEKLRAGQIKKYGFAGATGSAFAGAPSSDREPPKHHSHVQPRSDGGQFDGPPVY